MMTRVVLPCLHVVLGQLRAQAARFGSHVIVDAGIEGGILIEDLHADRIFLEIGFVPAKRLFYHETEKAAHAVRLDELWAGKNQFELGFYMRINEAIPGSLRRWRIILLHPVPSRSFSLHDTSANWAQLCEDSRLVRAPRRRESLTLLRRT